MAASMRGTVSGALHLGTIIDPESIRLGPLLAALLELYPLVDVSLIHGISGSVLQMLREKQLDACFYLGALWDPTVTVRQLAQEHYVVLGPAAWEAQLRGANWTELAAMPWLATPQGSSQHGLVDELHGCAASRLKQVRASPLWQFMPSLKGNSMSFTHSGP